MHRPDPVIDEIRAVRRKISQECDHDPAKLVAYYMRFQEQYRDRLVGRKADDSLGAEVEATVGETVSTP